MTSYQSPRDVRQALSSHAKAAARRLGGAPGDLVNRFYLHRLLVRVFRHDSQGWMLKGGQALLVRLPTARHSRDIDLLATSRAGLQDAVDALRAAAAVDLDDFIRYDFHSASPQRQERDSCKVRFTPYLGATRTGVVSVDVVTNLVPHGQPTVKPLEPPLGLDLGPGATDAAAARIWPLEDHVADKIAAMYERHMGGASSRYKDLVDLVIIALSWKLDGRITHTALRSEAARRRAAGVDLTLPAVFTIPERRSWERGYRAEAARASGLGQRYRTLANAETLADRFITPLLAADPPGMWNHAKGTWLD